MAVSKLWAVTKNLRQVIEYATNPEKTAKSQFKSSDYQALRTKKKQKKSFSVMVSTAMSQLAVISLSLSKSSMQKQTASKPTMGI